MIRHWLQFPSFLLITSKAWCFETKNLILKIESVAFTGSREKFFNTLASLGLRWWQHMSVRGLHKHCTVAEVLALEKLPVYPRFSYVHQVLLFHSHGAEEDFRSKRHMLWQSVRLKAWHLYLLQYVYHRLLFPWPAPRGIFSILFIFHRRSCNYWRTSKTYRKWQIASNFQICK